MQIICKPNCHCANCRPNLFIGTDLEESTSSEIRGVFARMNAELAGSRFPYNGWASFSQYGYCLEDGFKSKSEAEAFTIAYYSSRLNLIRQ